MATKLSNPVTRETAKIVGNRPILLTIANCGSQSDARIGVRQKGKRTQYVALLSDIYRVLALWHGQKESAARKAARREGIPWRIAKKKFLAINSI